jgi:hypothetical protein
VEDCGAHNCGCLLDTVSYNDSRSSIVVMNRCRTSDQTDYLVKMYADVSKINDCWVTHSGHAGPAIIADSLMSIDGGVFITTQAEVVLKGNPQLTVSLTGKTITRLTGSYISDGFRIGDEVITSGFSNAGNNGTFTITALTATVMTFGSATGLANETLASGGGIAAEEKPRWVDYCASDTKRTLSVNGVRCAEGVSISFVEVFAAANTATLGGDAGASGVFIDRCQMYSGDRGHIILHTMPNHISISKTTGSASSGLITVTDDFTAPDPDAWAYKIDIDEMSRFALAKQFPLVDDVLTPFLTPWRAQAERFRRSFVDGYQRRLAATTTSLGAQKVTLPNVFFDSSRSNPESDAGTDNFAFLVATSCMYGGNVYNATAVGIVSVSLYWDGSELVRRLTFTNLHEATGGYSTDFHAHLTDVHWGIGDIGINLIGISATSGTEITLVFANTAGGNESYLGRAAITPLYGYEYSDT